MKSAQDIKTVVLLSPATIATNSTTSARVDTAGFKYVKIQCIHPTGSNASTSAQWGVCKLTEADVTSVSSGSAIVAFTGTTNTVTDATNGYVITSYNNSSTARITEFNVDCRGRKRYLFLTIQAPASVSTVCAIAHLSAAEQMPNTASLAGVVERVIG